MVTYDSAYLYIETATGLKDKIAKIDVIINALLATALASASTDQFTEYVLDDGQTKIRATYKGTDAIFRSINVLERTKQIYINQVNGRTFRLVDGKSFRR